MKTSPGQVGCVTHVMQDRGCFKQIRVWPGHCPDAASLTRYTLDLGPALEHRVFQLRLSTSKAQSFSRMNVTIASRHRYYEHSGSDQVPCQRRLNFDPLASVEI